MSLWRWCNKCLSLSRFPKLWYGLLRLYDFIVEFQHFLARYHLAHLQRSLAHICGSFTSESLGFEGSFHFGAAHRLMQHVLTQLTFSFYRPQPKRDIPAIPPPARQHGPPRWLLRRISRQAEMPTMGPSRHLLAYGGWYDRTDVRSGSTCSPQQVGRCAAVCA